MEAMFNSQALVNIARMLAQQSGIRLEINPQTKTFRATQGCLTMPPLAVIAERFPQAADMEAYTIGAVYHESGHMLHTDYDLRKEFRKLYDGHEHFEVANGLGQAVEDVVIERAQIDRFLGAKAALTAMWRLLYRKYGVNDAQQMEPLKKAFSFLFHACRHSALRQDFTAHFAQVGREALEADLSPGLLNELDGQIRRLDFATSTKDGFEIAVSLLALFGIHPVQKADSESQQRQGPNQPGAQAPAQGQGDPQEEQLPEDQQQDGAQAQPGPGGQDEAQAAQEPPEAKQEGESGEAVASDGGSDAQEDANDADESPSANADAGDPTEVEDSDGGGTEESSQLGAEPVSDGDPDGAAEDELSEMVVKAIVELTDSLPEPPEMALSFGVKAGKGLAQDRSIKSNPTAGMVLRDEIAQQTMYATERLGTLLKAQTEAYTEFSKKGQLMAARIWKLKAGNLRIFRHTVAGVEYSTAIKILLDTSSSMRNGLRTAVRAAAFLPLTFEGVEGLHCSLDTFPGCRHASEPIKGFEERAQACLDKLASITASGGTPMVEAMTESSQELLDFTADRKIMAVITDGEPYDKVAARKMVKALQAEGVEVIGIGIGGETRQAMKVIFDDYCVIGSVHELTDKLAETMEAKLVVLQNVA